MAKNEIFHVKIGQNLKFLDTWELYTSKESLEHVEYKFKKKKYNFLKKIGFWKFSIFFSKGGIFDVKIAKNKNFHFSKIWKTKLKNDFYGTIQTWTETKSWILVVIAPTL